MEKISCENNSTEAVAAGVLDKEQPTEYVQATLKAYRAQRVQHKSTKYASLFVSGHPDNVENGRVQAEARLTGPLNEQNPCAYLGILMQDQYDNHRQFVFYYFLYFSTTCIEITIAILSLSGTWTHLNILSRRKRFKQSQLHISRLSQTYLHTICISRIKCVIPKTLITHAHEFEINFSLKPFLTCPNPARTPCATFAFCCRHHHAASTTRPTTNL